MRLNYEKVQSFLNEFTHEDLLRAIIVYRLLINQENVDEIVLSVREGRHPLKWLDTVTDSVILTNGFIDE